MMKAQRRIVIVSFPVWTENDAASELFRAAAAAGMGDRCLGRLG